MNWSKTKQNPYADGPPPLPKKPDKPLKPGKLAFFQGLSEPKKLNNQFDNEWPSFQKDIRKISDQLSSAHVSGHRHDNHSSPSSPPTATKHDSITLPPHMSFSATYDPSGYYEVPDVFPDLLLKPWRDLDWSKRSSMKEHLRGLQLSNPDAGKLRILVYGPIGGGKSSFINSIDSIFQEHMTSAAIAAAATDKTFTTKFQTHHIKDQNYASFLPFAICDIMGLEKGHSEGVNTEDLVKVLKGHIKDDFTFNPASPCSENDPGYNSSPKLSDRIHCLVSIIPANTISMMDDAVFTKMKELRAKAGSMRIPQVAILTKIDELCPRVADDITRVYRSKKIKEKMQECSNRLGVPMNCIFPVKNYHEEIQLNDEVDVLLLSALTFILSFANDHVAVMAPPPANLRKNSNPYSNLYMNIGTNKPQRPVPLHPSPR